MSAAEDDDPTSSVSDGSEGDFESWLRDAARAPEGEKPLPLPRVGQVVGQKYRIEEELGRGGMGAVFRATHTVSNKPVAVKWMLRPSTDERAKQRHTREAQAAGRIDHPNVVDVYDIGEEGDAGYLVMELLRGEALRRRLERGALEPTEAVDLLLPAVRGVAAAHREGVIHRDLKPDNVFLCRGPDGSEREAKVLDFGISSIAAPEYDSKTSLTKEGTVLGTPSYMSPEQLESAKAADTRTDVYALGVIFYEALTGRVPFEGDSYSALVLAIANKTPTPLRELSPSVPPALASVIERAMSRNKADRYESAQGLAEALAPFASVQTAGSGENPSLEQVRALEPTERRPSGALGIAAAAVLLAALAWWLSSGTDATTPIAAEGETATETETESATATEPVTESAAATETESETVTGSESESETKSVTATVTESETVTATESESETAAGTQTRAVKLSRSVDRKAPAARAKARRRPAPSSAPAPKKSARSGSISLDDL